MEYDHTAAQLLTTQAAGDTLFSIKPLLPGEQLVSADGRWKAVYRTDGNFATYATQDGAGPFWQAGVTNPSPGRAAMQSDGNFCLYTRAGTGYYCTYSHGKVTGPYFKMVMQNDRNLCIYDSFDRCLWGSG